MNFALKENIFSLQSAHTSLLTGLMGMTGQKHPYFSLPSLGNHTHSGGLYHRFVPGVDPQLFVYILQMKTYRVWTNE